MSTAMGKNNGAPPCCESTVNQTAALPQKLANTIFDQKDWAFVSQETATVKRLFIRERRSLALQWVRHTRQLATRIVIHNCCATPSNHQRAVNWLKLFSNYTLLLTLCIVLFFVIRWGNPIYATKLVAWAIDIVERLYDPPHTSVV
jgi:hypothetical protein